MLERSLRRSTTPLALTASVVLGLAALQGCSGTTPVDNDVPGDTQGVDATEMDTSMMVDVPVDNAPLVDSGCPPAARITPNETPAGYLQPVTVGYVRTVDGDTAHFLFPVGEETVRFLYINTEESHGAETTQFGIDTGVIVERILSTASNITVAVRENTSQRGTPDLDPYGRWLALIFVDGELLETRIVREGLSAYFIQFGCAPEPVHSALLYAEAEARANRRGIWAPGHPTDYRAVFDRWFGNRTCRPNPFTSTRCR